MTKSPTLSSIFEDSKKSIICQDILRYSSTKLNQTNVSSENKNIDLGFTAWEVTGWLINNCQNFIEFYTGNSKNNATSTNKIRNNIDAVKSRIDDLIYLKLINEIGHKKTKDSGNTPLYGLSTPGNIIYELLEYSRAIPEKKNMHAENIYNSWIDGLDKINSSIDIFLKIMFEKLKELNLFTKFIVDHMSLILYTKDLQNWDDFISYLGIIANNNVNDANLHLKIWEESIKEMDKETRDLLLYSFKLNLERKMEMNAKDPQGYEKERFENRDNQNVICIEGFCYQCMAPNIFGYDTIWFAKRVILQNVKPIVSRCIHCKQLSAEIPILD